MVHSGCCPLFLPHGGGHLKFHPGGGRGALIYSRRLAGVTAGKGPCPCSSSPHDLQTSGRLTHSPAPTQNRGPHGCAGPVPGSQSQVVNQTDLRQTVQLRDEFHTFDLRGSACAERGAAGSSGRSWASRRPPCSGTSGTPLSASVQNFSPHLLCTRNSAAGSIPWFV